MRSRSDSPSTRRRRAAEQWPETTANVWVAHSGVLATTHYDTSHNFVVQIFGASAGSCGRRRAAGLRLHPSARPSRRQARVRVVASGESGALSGSCARLPALQEVMGPGEILYVPPYWAHTVLTEEAGMSISVLSASWLEATWARAGWLDLPFGPLRQRRKDPRHRRLPRGAAAALLYSRHQRRCVVRLVWRLAMHAPIGAGPSDAQRAPCRGRPVAVPRGDRSGRETVVAAEASSCRVRPRRSRRFSTARAEPLLSAPSRTELLSGYVEAGGLGGGRAGSAALLCCLAEQEL